MTDKDKKNMVKARLLVLSEMFCEKTDDEHPMDTFEIIDYLADNGVPANTKILRSDIALLRQRGMDIVTITGRPNNTCSARGASLVFYIHDSVTNRYFNRLTK